VNGVGTLIALTFVLTVEDPHRFAKEREVAMWVCGPSAVIPVMVACEFFVVITAAFRTFYVLVIMEMRIPTDGDSRFELVSIAITNWVR